MHIIWAHDKRDINDLKPNPRNPRTVTKEKYKTLVRNLKRNGYASRLIINTDNMVLCGNQRLKALKELGYTSIDVLIPDKTLTEDQIDDMVITDNLSAGDWDTDMLGNSWDPVKLAEWGLPPSIFGISHYDIDSANDEPESKIKESKVKVCPHCGEILN